MLILMLTWYIITRFNYYNIIIVLLLFMDNFVNININVNINFNLIYNHFYNEWENRHKTILFFINIIVIKTIPYLVRKVHKLQLNLQLRTHFCIALYIALCISVFAHKNLLNLVTTKCWTDTEGRTGGRRTRRHSEMWAKS